MIIQKIKAFTLVELIIVIGILVILSTIWFTSYTTYLYSVSDANRISQLDLIKQWLDLMSVKSILPLPDDYVEIMSSTWTVIAYQWYAWERILNSIDYSKDGKDPKYETYFTYYLTANKKYFQLMWFLENNSSLLLSINDDISKVQAEVDDYSELNIKVVWNNLWVLTWVWSDLNKPIQEISSINKAWYAVLQWVDSNTKFQANFWYEDTLEKIWLNLVFDLITASSAKYNTPNTCPEWFIWVPWNARFNKEWFCVSKYEMSYTEIDSPWTPDSSQWWADWNTYAYYVNKDIDVRNDYPISSITQLEAINKCKSLWYWYHLITDEEWMTIARSIEWEKYNWSWWAVWDWFIWNGNSWDNYLWCTDNTWWRSYATKTWWEDSWNLYSVRSTCHEKRQLLLSNWEIIWDFAWNLLEHVNKWNDIDWEFYNSWSTHLIPSTGYFTWEDVWIDDIERENYWASELLISTWTWSWIWWIYDELNAAANIFIRWWSADLTANTWIYFISFAETPSAKSKYIGFRCTK